MKAGAGCGGEAPEYYRPRFNDLLQGKLEKFSLDALANLAAASGIVVEMNALAV